jgi:hypothetical protein
MKCGKRESAGCRVNGVDSGRAIVFFVILHARYRVLAWRILKNLAAAERACGHRAQLQDSSRRVAA